MKFNNIAVTILIAIACMTVAVWAKTGQSTLKVQKWGYMIVPTREVYSQIDKLGEDGWELAAIESRNDSVVYVFKRPKH
jgi:hypothetical protein